MRLLVIVGLAVSVSACRGDDPGPDTSGGAPRLPAKGGPTAGVTIHYDPDKGGSKVDGAPLHGDPQVCASLKSCCTAPGLALFCGLSQAGNNGDCAKSLKEVKAYARESNIKTPAACK